MVDETNKAFDEVAVSASKVTALIGEIAAASAEQFRGVDQINTSIGEIDHTVQQNAANSQETASAAEMMNAQSVVMKRIVDELVILVKGKKGKVLAKPSGMDTVEEIHD